MNIHSINFTYGYINIPDYMMLATIDWIFTMYQELC